jgi:hypothetical protein
MSQDKADNVYEVLNPWAEADPKPLRAINSRLTSLAGKKIGLLCNSKRAAKPIITVVERKLKEMFPTAETTWFRSRSFSVSALEPERKTEFEDFIKSVDAVVAAVAD